MTAQSIPCHVCGEPVPFGRRSCEACGTPVLLPPEPEMETATEPEPELAAAVEVEAPGEPPAGVPAPAPGFVPPVLRDWAPGGERTADVLTTPPPAPPAAEAPSPIAGAWLPPSSTHRPGAGATPGAAATSSASAVRPWASPRTAEPPRWPGSVAPDGSPAGASDSASPSIAGPSWPSPTTQPTVVATPPSPVAERPKPGDAPLFADLPFDTPDTLAAWLVAIGGGIATIGFFLPWAPQVLGSAGFGSYFDAWGFGTIAHLPVFLAALGTTLLSILSNRVAGWLRHGVLGLAVGGFVLGISWPYLVGGFGGQIGAFAEGVGAILLLIGGVLGAAPSRGSRETP